jgi:hypothetical protein
MAGSGFSDITLRVYQSFSPGIFGLSFMGCTSGNSPISFTAQAGTQYYVQAGSQFSSAGTLMVNFREAPRPGNDAFASATRITTLPFTDNVDVSSATREPAEPTPACGSPNGTIWYAFTPASTVSISASASGPFSTAVAAYTGSSLGGLTALGSRCFGSPVTFRATAGTTYYFQAGPLFGQNGSLQFRLAVAPAPVANFGFSPSDPSEFDTVQFFNFSSDPADAGPMELVWGFRGWNATAQA